MAARSGCAAFCRHGHACPQVDAAVVVVGCEVVVVEVGVVVIVVVAADVVVTVVIGGGTSPHWKKMSKSGCVASW
jgi:hypothetical protein